MPASSGPHQNRTQGFIPGSASSGPPGRVFTRAQLLTAIHGVAVESYERAVDAHIKNLRRKLEPDPARPRRLYRDG